MCGCASPHDSGEHMLELSELSVAAKAPTDRRIEPFETAGLFVLDPGLQLITNLLGRVGDQPGTAFPDQPRGDAVLVTDEQDRATRIKILENLAGKVTLVALVAQLQQKQNIRLHLELQRVPVGYGRPDRDTVADAILGRQRDHVVTRITKELYRDAIAACLRQQADRGKDRRRVANTLIDRPRIPDRQHFFLIELSRSLREVLLRI